MPASAGGAGAASMDKTGAATVIAAAITVQMALCVYWPPFSRTPGT